MVEAITRVTYRITVQPWIYIYVSIYTAHTWHSVNVGTELKGTSHVQEHYRSRHYILTIKRESRLTIAWNR